MTVYQPSRDYGPVAERVWPWSMTRGALAVVFGVLGFAWLLPAGTGLRTFAMVIAAFAILDGLANGVEAVRSQDSTLAVRGLAALVGIGYGVVLLLMSGLSMSRMIWFTAIWAFAIGALEIISDLLERGTGHTDWVYGLIMGLFAVAFGVVAVVMMPALSTMIWLAAGAAVLWGISALAMGGSERSLSHHR